MMERAGDRICRGRCQVRGDSGDASEEWTGEKGCCGDFCMHWLRMLIMRVGVGTTFAYSIFSSPLTTPASHIDSKGKESGKDH